VNLHLGNKYLVSDRGVLGCDEV